MKKNEPNVVPVGALIQPDNQLEPVTSIEILRAKRRALKVAGMTLALILAAVGCVNLLPEWRAAFSTVVFLACIYLFIFWQCDGADAFKLDKPLKGEACLRMRSLAEHDPAIANLVLRVRECGREIAWADLWQANAWVYKQKRAEQERARLELNGKHC